MRLDIYYNILTDYKFKSLACIQAVSKTLEIIFIITIVNIVKSVK